MLRKAKSEVLNLLIEKNPNYVSELSIKNRIKKFDSDVIDSAISALLESGEIDKKIDERKISGNPVSFYCIKDKSRYPIRETIRVGDVEVPRLISDSQIGLFPEILNEQLEHLADYTRNLEKRFLEIIQKEQRKYWANVLGIFGALLSILALVLWTESSALVLWTESSVTYFHAAIFCDCSWPASFARSDLRSLRENFQVKGFAVDS